MAKECICALGADECTGDTGISHPFQVGGSCDSRPCQHKELIDKLAQDTLNVRAALQKMLKENHV